MTVRRFLRPSRDCRDWYSWHSSESRTRGCGGLVITVENFQWKYAVPGECSRYGISSFIIYHIFVVWKAAGFLCNDDPELQNNLSKTSFRCLDAVHWSTCLVSSGRVASNARCVSMNVSFSPSEVRRNPSCSVSPKFRSKSGLCLHLISHHIYTAGLIDWRWVPLPVGRILLEFRPGGSSLLSHSASEPTPPSCARFHFHHTGMGIHIAASSTWFFLPGFLVFSLVLFWYVISCFLYGIQVFSYCVDRKSVV